MNEESYGIQGQRVRRSKGHESIRREALQDCDLSFKATGMLAYLLSLPENWRTDADRLSKAKNTKGKAREGRDAMQAGLRELEEAGYLIRRKYQDERGTWRWIWRYSDDPPDLQREDVSAGQTGDGLPDYGSTVSGSPGSLEVLEVEVSEKREPKEENPQPSSDAAASTVTDPPQADLFGDHAAAVPAGVQPRTNGHVRTGPGRGVAPPSEGDSRATTADLPPAVLPGPSRAELAAVHAALFEEFWTTYAHKVGKGAARKAWTVACRKADPREVINAAARYAASRRGEDPRFTPHASTWLNGERWLDEPEYVRNGSGPARDGHRNGHVAYQNPPESAYVRTKPRHERVLTDESDHNGRKP